ncbi:MAG: DNA-formamidopyrimidine glycosylase family protein [Candidatus Spechtbacterales bacterium]
MPEIIEAEITRQKLAPALKGRRILKFTTDCPRGFVSEKKIWQRGIPSLKNLEITGMSRKGKVVVLNIKGGKVIGIHQRMSGHIAFNNSHVASKHSHFIFEMDNKKSFSLVDPRKFGIVWYGSEKWFGQQPYIKKLGKDAMKINEKDFVKVFEGAGRASVKSFLLRQDKIAGLGNIACDETLWHARLNPAAKVCDLTDTQLRGAHKSMKKILVDLLRYGGTSMSDWLHPDGSKGNYQNKFKIYKRQKCRRCSSQVKYIKVAGRGTYFCPKCQK